MVGTTHSTTDAVSYITGQPLTIDGGYTAG
jgi:hypothetical protein